MCSEQYYLIRDRRLTAVLNGKPGMLTPPRHLVPLVFPVVRVYPTLDLEFLIMNEDEEVITSINPMKNISLTVGYVGFMRSHMVLVCPFYITHNHDVLCNIKRQ